MAPGWEGRVEGSKGGLRSSPPALQPEAPLPLPSKPPSLPFNLEAPPLEDPLRRRGMDPTPNESHTRSDEFPARSRYAVHGRDQQRTSNHRAQPSTATRSRGKELNSAPLPCLPGFFSVSKRALSFTLEPDNGLCARMDEQTCIQVITVDVTFSEQDENNKCSACGNVAGQAQTLLLTRVAKTTSTASWRSANSAHSRTQRSVGSTLSNSSHSPFEIHI